MAEGKEKNKYEELIKKYNINLESLKNEQEKLSKQLSIKDSADFNEITKIGAIETTFIENKIIAGIVVLMNNEIIEQEYHTDKLKFPYIPGFRAYRELPVMVECFNKLEEKPELVLIHGHGISHERLGLASHFSIVTGIPAIGIAESLINGEVKNNDILLNGKKVGRVLNPKQGGNPIYLSPGNLISIESSEKIIKSLIKEGHKLPEIMRLAHKYVKEIREELS